MIEVLVAVAVLSIGLLGTAALQVQSKRASLGSVQRTLASMLVNDLFERMRANPTAFDVYLNEMNPDLDVGESVGTEPTPVCDGPGAGNACDPDELAEHDVWEWERLMIGVTEVAGTANTGGLVLPLACMTGPAGGGAGTYTISINWRGHSEFTGAPPLDECGVSADSRYEGEEGTDTLRRVVEVSSYLNDE